MSPWFVFIKFGTKNAILMPLAGPPSYTEACGGSNLCACNRIKQVYLYKKKLKSSRKLFQIFSKTFCVENYCFRGINDEAPCSFLPNFKVVF